MRTQLLLCFLALALTGSAQKTGFTSFSSHSGVHTNEKGKKLIYAIGEPINSYVHSTTRSAPNDPPIQQGLLHSDILAEYDERTEIQVRVFLDKNSDGHKDTEEEYIAEGNIKVDGEYLIKLTREEGISYSAEPGTYKFVYFNQNDLFTYTRTRSVDVVVEDGDKYKSVEFGIAPDEIIEKAQLHVGAEQLRCFRPVEYSLSIRNTGSTKLVKTVYLEVDARLVPIYFHQQPDVIITDNIVGWDISLEPGQSNSFKYEITAPEVDSPDDIGVEYSSNAWVELQNNGTAQIREEAELVQELRCAYDPNDKLVSPDRPDSLALLDDPLVYTVRFQNTGNDVADDVVVADTMDVNLDMSTFYVLDSSHPDKLEVLIDEQNEHIINFQFKNIFLPDSTTNEPGSNGFVTYSITPVEGLPLNTEINNTAHIYFDFNPAIVTNTTSSTLVDTFPIPEDIVNEFIKIICEGETFEGYSDTGEYEDIFSLPSGIDSIRLLRLFKLTTEREVVDKVICQGDSYEGHTETGTYIDTLPNGACGTIIELNLEVQESYQSYEQVELCSEDVYKGYKGDGVVIERYQSQNNCDSIHIIDLIVSGGTETISREICQGQSYEGYSEEGIYEDVFVTREGCDSTRTLQLTIVTSISNEIEQTICQGEEYEGYSSSGTYEDRFGSQSGCDSIRTLILNVENNQDSFIEQEICQGEEHEGYTSTGTYEDVLVALNGCDSLRTLILTVNENPQTFIDQEICEGDSFEGYITSGTYEDWLVSSKGCDSVRTLVLNVSDNYLINQDVEICEGEDHNGYDESGTYEELLISTTGCDSTNIINLTVLASAAESLDVEICQGDSYEGYTNSGTYEDLLAGVNGCDSLRTINLIVNEVITIDTEVEICSGEAYEGYNTSGTYQDLYQTTDGCDSIRTLSLNVIPASETFEIIHLCIGESYEGFTEEGSYTIAHSGSDGCDSIRNIEIVRIDRSDPICAFEYDESPKRFDDTAFLNVYPNPSSDMINILVDKSDKLPSEIEIQSIDKKRIHYQVIDTKITTLDISNYANGMYLLILRNENNSYIHRFVKS